MASLPTEKLQKLSIDELGDYLIERGIPPAVVTAFTDNQIDGESFIDLTECDVKEIVKPLGIVKKIVRILQDAKSTSPSGVPSSSMIVEPGTPSMYLPCMPSPPSVSGGSTVSVASSGEVTRAGVSNFTIPSRWRPSIMKAIEEKKLTPDVRNEIVRDLVTHMYGCMEKPSSANCKFVAQRLILKYPFMRDTKGTGFGSWEKKLCDRMSNVLRKRKVEANNDDPCPPKRGRPKRLIASLDSRYPPLEHTLVTPEEERSAASALEKEMSFAKPRRDVFLPLMKSTFMTRRHYVLHEAASVEEILNKYPALKDVSAIKQEMELILSRPGAHRTFSSEWSMKWAPAILSYCRSLKKEILQVLANNDFQDDSEGDERLALILLLPLFAPKKTNATNCLYEKCLIGEDPEIVASQPPLRNSPRLAEFEDEDGGSIFFILIEQSTLCQVSTLSEALFIWFCTHYIFHLSYCSSIAELCIFFQEFVFGLPAVGKRSATYLSMATDIQQLTVR